MVQVKLTLRFEDISVNVLITSVSNQDSRRIYFHFQSCGYTCENFMDRSHQPRNASSPAPRMFRGRLLWMLNLLLLWNWKSALLSVMLRVPVFAAATVRRGPEAFAGAILTEAVVCAFNAGCYAAVVQVVRNRKPVWLVATVITVL